MTFFRIILLIFGIGLSFSLFTKTADGQAKAYRNHQDYINEKPLYQTSFRFIMKSDPNAYGSYKVKINDRDINKKEINRGISIITDGACFYVNGYRLGLMGGFYKFNYGKRYYYFQAEPQFSQKQQQGMANAGAFGIVGVTAASAAYDVSNKRRTDQVYDLNTGNIHLLTKEYLQDLLKPTPLLLNEYNATVNNEDLEVLLEYLEILNGLQ
jgi:hypothetical protein